MSGARLGPGREFDVIRDIVARWGETASGIGDDAASLDVPRGERIVISTDAFVENTHFRSTWLEAREVGYRATTAALSDLAAMAARPLGVLFAVNVPESWRAKLGDVAEGVADAARAAGTRIIGGNIAASAELSITTTVIGSAFSPLTRGGARAGDRLYVTGRLGGPALAISAWQSGATPSAADRARFARPSARLSEARWLADRGATSALDISDGLLGDAAHLATASGLGARIRLESIPLVSGATPETAARSGEEYELLVSAPSLDAAAFAEAFGIPLTDVGEIVEEGGGVVLLDRGRRVAAPRGHDHFST